MQLAPGWPWIINFASQDLPQQMMALGLCSVYTTVIRSVYSLPIRLAFYYSTWIASFEYILWARVLTRQCFVVTCKKWRRTAVPRQDKVTVWGFFMICSFVPIFPDTIVANVHHTHRALCFADCKSSWSLKSSPMAVNSGDQVPSLEVEHLDDPTTLLHPGCQHNTAGHL